MHFLIYKITNKINNKEYTGKHKTDNLDDGYMGSGKLITRAIQKYGAENFIKEILYIFDSENKMNEKEKEIVTEEYCSREDTYNLCPGGHGGFGFINKNGKNIYGKNGTVGHGLENLVKNSSLHMKKIGKYDEYRQSISNGVKKYFLENGSHWSGKKHDESTKIKIGIKNSESQKGSKNSQYGTCWVTNGKESKKIKKEEFDFYSELGYIKGRNKG